MSLKFPPALVHFFLLEWLQRILGWHSGPNGFLWNTASSFMSLFSAAACIKPLDEILEGNTTWLCPEFARLVSALSISS